jgi:hypothetical protein
MYLKQEDGWPVQLAANNTLLVRVDPLAPLLSQSHTWPQTHLNVGVVCIGNE